LTSAKEADELSRITTSSEEKGLLIFWASDEIPIVGLAVIVGVSEPAAGVGDSTVSVKAGVFEAIVGTGDSLVDVSIGISARGVGVEDTSGTGMELDSSPMGVSEGVPSVRVSVSVGVGSLTSEDWPDALDKQINPRLQKSKKAKIRARRSLTLRQGENTPIILCYRMSFETCAWQWRHWVQGARRGFANHLIILFILAFR
jgi:hypothetical protein